MGFYATEQLDTVLESHQENLTPPSKNRVWNFFTTSGTCAGFFESQPVESHQEKWPTPTKPVSGVRYYGHRYYSTELSRWLSRDPIGDIGGLSGEFWNHVRAVANDRLAGYIFAGNDGVSTIDLLGAVAYSTYRLEGGPNGVFSWLIKWKPGAEELLGWIVQEVEYRFVARDCKTGLWLPPVQGHIYEAWSVTNGNIQTSKFDEWKNPEPFPSCTYGSIWSRGKDAFVWIATMPPATGSPSECRGGAWCSSTPPWFWGLSRSWISEYSGRTLLGFWDSCSGASDTVLSTQ